MPTAYSAFYVPLRVVLGDRDPHGNYAYADADLNAALDVLFLTGDAPAGYAASANNITPEVTLGDHFATLLYRAALLLIHGEDGGGSMRTKALTVTDAGHRKRDLLTHFRMKISAIENGGGIVFETRQSLAVFLQNISGDQLLDWYSADAYLSLPALPALR